MWNQAFHSATGHPQRTSLVQVLDRFLPQTAAALRNSRYRRELHQIFQDLVARYGAAVQTGPFQGMIYALPGIGAAEIYHYGGVPKLLGCYEAELHGIFSAVAAIGYDTVLNIGCAEGYYVAGLARLVPHTHVFAFDIDPNARRLCEETARANEVLPRVTLLSECQPAEFDRLATGRTLVVCDCEGAELKVLRPDLARALRSCDVLVELHPHVDPSISTEIPRRFSATHVTTRINAQPRDPASFAALRGHRPRWQKMAVSEFRERSGEWAFFASKETGLAARLAKLVS